MLAVAAAGAVHGTRASDAPAASALAQRLRRQTQALVDALAPGDAEVWEHYLHPDVLFTSEDGTLFTKAEMVAQAKPLPAGVTGAIQVTEFKVHPQAAVAVTAYVLDEHEHYHGQELHCQYRCTDTWLKSAVGWRLLASQVLALRADPPALSLTDAEWDQYVGRYRLGADLEYEIARDGPQLLARRSDGAPRTWLAEARDVLFCPGRPRYRMIFHRSDSGRINGFAERREAWDLNWSRVE
jgi:hypothetical protein